MWTIFKVSIKSVTILLVLQFGSLAQRQVGSSLPEQGSTPTPCTGRQSLNQWTSRKVPIILIYSTALDSSLPQIHTHIFSLSFRSPSSSHSVSPCSCSASSRSNFLNFSPEFPLKMLPDKVTFLQLPKSRGHLLVHLDG